MDLEAGIFERQARYAEIRRAGDHGLNHVLGGKRLDVQVTGV